MGEVKQPLLHDYSKKYKNQKKKYSSCWVVGTRSNSSTDKIAVLIKTKWSELKTWRNVEITEWA